ncbi:MAG: TIGR03663 family protein [Candidatus Hydrogenedentes bacterium]|nr:TIGR03663 family protein [Candidatus Hydrogenedentota bacterium]
MRSPLLFAVCIVAVAAGALALRLPRLELRPLHNDEANQAVKAGKLLDKGYYRYDPREHHGPTLYYLTLPVAWISGAHRFSETTEFTFRVVPVLFGAVLILLLWPLGSGLGRTAAIAAAALTALSPAMVYYSRYYVQEMLLVFFTAAFITCGWRYLRRPAWGRAVATGLSAGLMHATKETCVIAFAATGGALAITYGIDRMRGTAPVLKGLVRPLHFAIAGVAAVTVSVVFFTSFFTYAHGPVDSISTYFSYVDRAAGGQAASVNAHYHDHPWYFYLALLSYFHNGLGPWWSEGAVLAFAVIGIIVSVRRKSAPDGDSRLLHFLAIYTVLITGAYSMIPYKTPWCLLSFYWGMILMAGVGVAALGRWATGIPRKALVACLLAGCVFHLGVQTYRANFVFPANPVNPYVYAHTVPNFLELARRVDDIAKLSPDGNHMLIKVIEPAGDYWPVPFYLRSFDQVGYWAQSPDDVDAPVIITSPQGAPLVDARVKDKYKTSYFGLRPDVLLITYIRTDLWDAFIETRQSPAPTGSR